MQNLFQLPATRAGYHIPVCVWDNPTFHGTEVNPPHPWPPAWPQPALGGSWTCRSFISQPRRSFKWETLHWETVTPKIQQPQCPSPSPCPESTDHCQAIQQICSTQVLQLPGCGPASHKTKGQNMDLSWFQVNGRKKSQRR